MQFTTPLLISLLPLTLAAYVPGAGIHFVKRALGDVTLYDVAQDPLHPSACDTTNDPSEMVAAVPIAMGKGMCGTSATITRDDGRTVTVTIVDLCEGCAATDIDLSRGAFAEVAEESEGRVQMEVVMDTGAAGATGAAAAAASSTSTGDAVGLATSSSVVAGLQTTLSTSLTSAAAAATSQVGNGRGNWGR